MLLPVLRDLVRDDLGLPLSSSDKLLIDFLVSQLFLGAEGLLGFLLEALLDGWVGSLSLGVLDILNLEADWGVHLLSVVNCFHLGQFCLWFGVNFLVINLLMSGPFIASDMLTNRTNLL